ncbi:MAG: sulfatase [Candidatus Altiarchaeota archaeon]
MNGKKKENGRVRIIVFSLLILSVIAIYYTSQGEDYVCKDCNVLLITVDSLRPDHLGYMGYARNTSPALDRIVSEGVVFTRAFSQSSFTPPSLGSILTSKYVSDHGLKNWDKMDFNQTTIAEILEENGYETVALTRVPKLDEHNLDQGFQYTLRGNYWRAEDFNKAVLEWFDGNYTGGKYFVWMHYYDPHRRYEPLPPFDKIFNRRYDPEKDLQRQDKSFFVNFWSGNVSISRKMERDLITQYDGEIAYTDHNIGLLLGNLSEMGLLENTIVVISADHGESLNEHRQERRFMFSHDPMLYDQVVHVPLIFWGNGIPKGVKVENLVESIDIAPTMLSILGIGHNDTGMFGWDLTKMFSGDEVESKKQVYSECWGWEEKKMVRTEDYKYIRDFRRKKGSLEELYGLEDDPEEKENILGGDDRIKADMILKMDKFINRHKHTPAKEMNLSDDLEERLKELGYIY